MDETHYRIPVIRLAIIFPHTLCIQRDSAIQQDVKEVKVVTNEIQLLWLPCLRRWRKVNEDDMVEFCGGVSVKD